MSKIQIVNLQPAAAGVELFQTGESFLTTLHPTEAHQVQGGKKKSGKSGKSKSGKNKSNKSGNNLGYCYTCLPCLPPPPPCDCGGPFIP
jgi:hypothetical protein